MKVQAVGAVAVLERLGLIIVMNYLFISESKR